MESSQEYVHNDSNSPIQSICENVRKDCKVDFAGIAFEGKKSKRISWYYAAGNRNEKFRRMEVRYGKGIAGQVIATGRPVEILSFPENLEGKTVDYPIMLAEQLVSARAVPIYRESLPKGAFLIGRRTSQSFSEEEQKILEDAVNKLERLFSHNLLPGLEGEWNENDHAFKETERE
jgi:nitrogen regulatory protein A